MNDFYKQIMNDTLVPGEAVQLSKHIVRVVADNGSFMTGPGTNSYIIGEGELAVIDAGPLSENHCQALLKAAEPRGRISHILLTHTHSDHSPGVERLQAETGAKIALYPKPTGKPFYDKAVTADIPLQHGDFLEGFEPAIQAVHTPGHASNHLCFYLPECKALFTGDHLMNGSTVVIASPDGNMSEYLDSLELLKSFDIEYLCPGHGAVMDKPFEVVDKTIAHRMAREQKVLQALEKIQQGSVEQVLSEAYADTPGFLHGLAKMSLTAHLEKLQREGKALLKNTQWQILS